MEEEEKEEKRSNICVVNSGSYTTVKVNSLLLQNSLEKKAHLNTVF